ncbi:MAG: hypothetical protein WC264_00080 [Candidatus Paceibacterota bacterium]|jgi:hypothetical protein
MKVSIDRIVAIITCMYKVRAEVVVNIAIDQCSLYYGLNNNQLLIFYNEVNCLIYNDIIELDCGCDEPGHETKVYRLTEIAQEKIQEIIKNKSKLLLKELKE